MSPPGRPEVEHRRAAHEGTRAGTWVLLRGLTRGSGHWAEFPAQLRRRLGAIDLIALDLPGNGALHTLPSPTRIEAMGEAGRARLDALGAHPPYHLLAVSMGAMVAIDWAARAPHTLAGCVLVNTSVAGLSPWVQRLRPGAWAGLLRAVLSTDRLAQERAVLRWTSRNPRAAAGVVDAWATLRETQPVARCNALRQVLAAARYRVPSVRPAVPLLVLSSRGDALVDPRCSAALAARWQADHAEHPSAGHDLTLDDGPWVAERIAEWLPRTR